MALNGAGNGYFDLTPDLCIYPGDHLILRGTPGDVKKAEEYLRQQEPLGDDQGPSAFAMAKVVISPGSPQAGQTLTDFRFRRDHHVSVVGVQRGENRMTTPSASLALEPGDELIVVGSEEAIARIQASSPLVRSRHSPE